MLEHHPASAGSVAGSDKWPAFSRAFLARLAIVDEAAAGNREGSRHDGHATP
jgi:hypothetical protein